MVNKIEVMDYISKDSLTSLDIGNIRKSLLFKIKHLKDLSKIYYVDFKLPLQHKKNGRDLLKSIKHFCTFLYKSFNYEYVFDLIETKKPLDFKDIKELAKFGKFFSQLALSQYMIMERLDKFLKDHKSFAEYLLSEDNEEEDEDNDQRGLF